jgi:hypothetical protein
MNQHFSFKVTDDNLWQVMAYVDRVCDLVSLLQCTSVWYRENPDKTHADLEAEFRKRNFNTHIYPAELEDDAIPEGYFFRGIGCEDVEWLAVFACRPYQEAKDEAEAACKDYETRMKRLAKSGVIQQLAPAYE